MNTAKVPEIDDIVSCGTKLLHFTVEGNPVPQGRPRFSRRSCTARDPESSRKYKAEVKEAAEQAVYESNWVMAHEEQPVRVTLHIFKPIRKGTAQWKSKAAKWGLTAPIVKNGDIENIAKGILDGMTGVVYKDDCQVYSLHCEARFSDRPRVEVYIESLFINVSDVKAKYNTLEAIEKGKNNGVV